MSSLPVSIGAAVANWWRKRKTAFFWMFVGAVLGASIDYLHIVYFGPPYHIITLFENPPFPFIIYSEGLLVAAPFMLKSWTSWPRGGLDA